MSTRSASPVHYHTPASPSLKYREKTTPRDPKSRKEQQTQVKPKRALRQRTKGAIVASAGTTRCEQVVNTTEVRYMINVGNRVWAAERDGSISVRDALTGEIEHTIGRKKGDQDEVEFCWCLLLVDNNVWAGFSTGVIRIHNAETFALCNEVRQHAGGVYCLSMDHNRVYSGSNDFEVFQWDAETFEFIRQFSGHKNAVRSLLAIGCDLFSGSDDHTICMWDAVTGDVQTEFTGHRGGVLALMIDRTYLWSASEDATIKIWNLEKDHVGECLHTITQHKGRVVSLLKVGDLVLSAGVDKTICAFSTSTFQLVGRYTDHSGYVNNLACIAQCTKFQFWSCSNDKTIRIWSAESAHRFITDSIENEESHRDKMLMRLQTEVDSLRAQLADSNSKLTESELQRQMTVAELEAKLHTSQNRYTAEVERMKLEQQARASNISELEAMLRAARDEVASLNDDLDEARNNIADKNAIIEANKREKHALQEKYDQQIDRKDAMIAERDQTIHNLRLQIADHQNEISQLQGMGTDSQRILSEHKAKIASLNETLDQNRNHQDNMHRQIDQLKSEIQLQETDIQALNKDKRDLNVALSTLKEENNAIELHFKREKDNCNVWKSKWEATEADNAQLSAEIKWLKGQIEEHKHDYSTLQLQLHSRGDDVVSSMQQLEEERKRVKALEEKLFGVQSRLRDRDLEIERREAAFNNEKNKAGDLESQILALERQKQELQSRETEFEFVIQSRSELVRQIWELFCEISDTKKKLSGLLCCPSVRQLNNPFINQEISRATDGVSAAKKRNKKIVANYFTEIEKLHVGTSPYYFQPDDDVAKYRINEVNEQKMRKLIRTEAAGGRPGGIMVTGLKEASSAKHATSRSVSPAIQQIQYQQECSSGQYRNPSPQPLHPITNTSAPPYASVAAGGEEKKNVPRFMQATSSSSTRADGAVDKRKEKDRKDMIAMAVNVKQDEQPTPRGRALWK